MTSLSLRLPSGPRGKLRNTWRVLKSPRHFFQDCVAKYGDPFTMNAINGMVVVTGRPELIEQIFRADPDTFSVFASEGLKPILGAGSLLMMEGPDHRAERKRVAPPLHGDRMRVYGETMKRIAEQAIRKREDGQPFTGLQLGTEISLDVILQTVFGADSEDLLQEFRVCTRAALDRSWPVLFFSPKMQFGFAGLSPMDRLRTAQQQLRGALKRELDRRGSTIADREDILSIVARPTEDEPHLDFEHLADSWELFCLPATKRLRYRLLGLCTICTAIPVGLISCESRLTPVMDRL
ncbi:cytochrome P450 [Rubripirellula amarantea]|nr:cytochrome P450 [Rubripirellula amarantea]